jgi:hypothetical protein
MLHMLVRWVSWPCNRGSTFHHLWIENVKLPGSGGGWQPYFSSKAVVLLGIKILYSKTLTMHNFHHCNTAVNRLNISRITEMKPSG